MKKITALILGTLSGIIAVLACVYTTIAPEAIFLVILFAPVSIALLVIWASAGTKEGDIPFMGY